MIDPKELRIGNLASVNTAQAGWWETTHVTAESFAKSAAGTLICESYEPIPITPEWLEKLGFEKNEYNSYQLKNIELSEEIIRSIPPKKTGVWYVEYFQVRIKHVHQIQNLYHALTGDELTLKKP